MNSPSVTPAPSGSAGRGRVAAVTAVVLWSAGNVMVRSVPLDGVQIAFWRVLLGAVVYRAALRLAGRSLSFEQMKASAPAGIALSLEIATFFVALKATTVANATVIGALVPIVLMRSIARNADEQVTRWLVGAAFLAVAGVAVVILGSASEAVWSARGDALSVVALLLFAAYFHFAKSARQTVPAFELQTAMWMVGSVVLLPLAVIDAGGIVVPSASNWLWLVGLLAVPGTGHLLMNWSHSTVRLSLTSMLTLATPVLSTIGAVFVLDESIDGLQVVGILVVVAVLVAVIRRDVALRDAG